MARGAEKRQVSIKAQGVRVVNREGTRGEVKGANGLGMHDVLPKEGKGIFETTNGEGAAQPGEGGILKQKKAQD